MLLRDLFQRETTCIVCRLRMVGDPEILEAALPRRFCHCLERLGAVRRGRMTVKYAAEVFVADKLWQCVLGSFIYLVPAFA